MPRPKKYADTVVKSFSVEREVYERLRAVLAVQGKSVSEEVNMLLKRRLAELEDSQEPLREAVDGDAKLCSDAADMHFLKEGKIALPLHPNQIIFIGTLKPIKHGQTQT
jgi:predicted CopG family antitoxin